MISVEYYFRIRVLPSVIALYFMHRHQSRVRRLSLTESTKNPIVHKWVSLLQRYSMTMRTARLSIKKKRHMTYLYSVTSSEVSCSTEIQSSLTITNICRKQHELHAVRVDDYEFHVEASYQREFHVEKYNQTIFTSNIISTSDTFTRALNMSSTTAKIPNTSSISISFQNTDSTSISTSNLSSTSTARRTHTPIRPKNTSSTSISTTNTSSTSFFRDHDKLHVVKHQKQELYIDKHSQHEFHVVEHDQHELRFDDDHQQELLVDQHHEPEIPWSTISRVEHQITGGDTKNDLHLESVRYWKADWHNWHQTHDALQSDRTCSVSVLHMLFRSHPLMTLSDSLNESVRTVVMSCSLTKRTTLTSKMSDVKEVALQSKKLCATTRKRSFVYPLKASDKLKRRSSANLG